MKKTITRDQARLMAESLGNAALGHMSEDMLAKVIGNYNALSTVARQVMNLNSELHRRIYADMEEAKMRAFFALVSKGRFKAAKEEHPDIWPLFEKHNAVLAQLVSKEVEVDIEEIDEDEFIKAIIMGRKDVPVAEIKATFSPMFPMQDSNKEQQDYSELEDLL